MPDITPKQIAEFIKPFKVEPGRRVRLERDFDPAGTRQVTTREAKDVLAQGVELLAEYQERLAAQDTYGVVMVLQAMDAAGKDGTIRHVMSGVNPQGVQVSSFKVPSAEELDHDYLWRYAKKLPERGNIGIFNRSLLRGGPRRPRPSADPRRPEAAARLEARRCLEAPLPRDQRLGALPHRPGLPVRQAVPQRSARRSSAAGSWRASTEPEKNWKFSANDAKERAFWDAYQKAFSEVLSNTSTDWAPVVRHPGRRQAVRPGRRRRRAGAHPDRDRPADTPRSAPRRRPRSRRPRLSSRVRPRRRGARPDRARACREGGQQVEGRWQAQVRQGEEA